MSCLDDSDDHLRWLAPTDLSLDYMGITHLDFVTRVKRGLGIKLGLRCIKCGLNTNIVKKVPSNEIAIG